MQKNSNSAWLAKDCKTGTNLWTKLRCQVNSQDSKPFKKTSRYEWTWEAEVWKQKVLSPPGRPEREVVTEKPSPGLFSINKAHLHLQQQCRLDSFSKILTPDWVRKEQKRIEVKQDSQDTKCQRPIGLQTSFDRVHIGDTKTEQCHIAKSQKQVRKCKKKSLNCPPTP